MPIVLKLINASTSSSSKVSSYSSSKLSSASSSTFANRKSTYYYNSLAFSFSVVY